MKIINIIGKRVGVNGGGVKVCTGLVSAEQRVFSLDEAGRMVIRKQAVFLYRGEKISDPDELPEVAPGFETG